MITKLFQGPYAIALTPFLSDGSIDYDGFEVYLDRLCATKISGIVVCGSTGEFSALTEQENMRIMTFAARVVNARKPLICGATAGDYAGTIRYLNHMARLDADGALIAPPYYFPLDSSDVYAFYKTISLADAGVPIVAYQIPQFTSPIPLDAYERILHLPQVVGIKNSSGNLNQLMQQIDLRNRIRPSFSVLTGSDESLFAVRSVGGDGSFTALAYLFPDEIADLYESFSANPEHALDVQMRLLPLLRAASSVTFPLGFKALGALVGIRNDYSVIATTESTRAKLNTLQDELSHLLNAFKKR